MCYVRNGRQLLLGMKKRGLGAGNYNGFGGKVEQNETIEQGALREIREEANVTVDQMAKLGELTFIFPHEPKWDQVVHVFVADSHTGNPIETAEMTPEWFDLAELPYEKMWVSDADWLPHVLGGQFVRAKFVWAPDGSILEKKIDLL